MADESADWIAGRVLRWNGANVVQRGNWQIEIHWIDFTLMGLLVIPRQGRLLAFLPPLPPRASF